ncbi:hypothetical protein Bbelb_421050 [Branchiostoma belcheri]|nr:hypothetical protein Bbelb_421050 [Branchiostoma belcheri]
MLAGCTLQAEIASRLSLVVGDFYSHAKVLTEELRIKEAICPTNPCLSKSTRNPSGDSVMTDVLADARDGTVNDNSRCPSRRRRDQRVRLDTRSIAESFSYHLEKA